MLVCVHRCGMCWRVPAQVKGLSPKGPRSPQDVAKETKAEQKNALLSSHEKSNTCIKSSKRAPDETQVGGTA